MVCVFLLRVSDADPFNVPVPTNAGPCLTALPLSTITAKMGDHVLDVCCGSGDLAFLLSEKVGSNGKEWMIDNAVVPVAFGYGLSEEYTYHKSSIREFLTGRELEKLALEVGFSTARHYEISGRLMGCLVALH